MKAVLWVFGVAAVAAFAYGWWSWRRRRAELNRASEERFASLMAHAIPAAVVRQKLLLEAAAKAAEADEPMLSIELYARLLARYPDSAFAAQARAAVEVQKKNLAKT